MAASVHFQVQLHMPNNNRTLRSFVPLPRLRGDADLEAEYQWAVGLANWSFPRLPGLPELESRLEPEQYLQLLVEGRFEFRAVKAEDPFALPLRPSVTELGICYSYNSRLSGYSHPKSGWSVAVVSCLLGAVWLSASTWARYQQSPTVISLEKNYLDWNTTFPASTVCPASKLDPDQALLAAPDLLPSLDPEEGARRLELLANASYGNFEVLEELQGLDPNKYFSVYQNLLFNFSYHLSNSNCEPVAFTLTVNEMGICYTLNSNAAIYMSLEHWGRTKWTKLEERKDLFQGNPLDGDTFAQVMDMNTAMKVAIHAPEDLPEYASRWFLSEEKHYLTLDLIALTIYSSEATRGLSVSQRKCRFMEESNLETSPVFSYNLCRAECRMRLANALCGCVPYFYRNIGKYKICDVKGMQCLSKFKERLRKLRSDKGEREVCDCYPSCDDVVYAVQGDTSVPWFLGSNFKYGLLKYPTSRIKRDIVFGVYDLLVQFGGSVGLCLGCSLLTVAEIGYFLTLRLSIFMWNKGRI